MHNDLYEQDILVWSEKQAELLRKMARGERVNEAVDWDNLVDEVEAVGRSELQGVESLIAQALLHLLKLCVEPESQAAAHWKSEVIGFLAGARRRFSPGMRQRIELDELYDTALRQVQVIVGPKGSFLPQSNPYALDDLLSPKADPETLAEQLRPRSPV